MSHTAIDAAAEPVVINATPVIDARELAVKGPRGTVFGPLDVSVFSPVTLVLGSRGSGRTSLLLALAGRMRISSGRVSVMGIDVRTDAASARRATGIAGFDAIDLLEPTARVSDAVRERLAWTVPWYQRVPRLTPTQLRDSLLPVFGPLSMPEPATLVRDLSESQELLLRMALASFESPAMILVDDLDAVKDPRERADVASRIEHLSRTGTRFVVGSADARDLDLFDPETRALIALGR